MSGSAACTVVSESLASPAGRNPLSKSESERMRMHAYYTERMLARQGWTGRVVQTTDRDEAILIRLADHAAEIL